ncbi:MAG: hypothetical protein ABS35_30345 [Kaistia sp. SCN 65-12]|nr:MAG: hypothetical protein ABS35_30345 [Kaistia sp. SCN 65-12]
MGGSSGGKKKANEPKVTVSNRPTITVPGSMPGQLDALSQQLAMGYGQSQPDIMSLLNQVYQPMTLPDYSQPFTIPKPPKDSKAFGDKK